MQTHYIYWISTTLLSLLYIASAMLYITKKAWVRQTLIDFGYPGYLLPLLVAVKILAVVAILSRISVLLSDLAYAGMFFHLLLSALAHIGVRKPGGALPAGLGLVLLIASFATQNAARDLPSPYGDVITGQHQTLSGQASAQG
ncbi:DoxX family protein [Pectobacterium carotovorum]|uniref:DoxX family protein n=1 Tax=Pectobacterium carotovorum TaxID=554 RepID=UPI0029DE4B33|nr:DoxX family protein [Pectobacterium carotovorum]MDX6914178.1 DoxX family protein [Pectobacterium carotovorum]